MASAGPQGRCAPRPSARWPLAILDTGGEFDVRRMFQSEPPLINLNGAAQASLGAAPAGRGRQSGEFDVRRMFLSEPPLISRDEAAQASLGAAPAGRGRQSCEFATSVTVGSGPNQSDDDKEIMADVNSSTLSAHGI